LEALDEQRAAWKVQVIPPVVEGLKMKKGGKADSK
jgi:hypothetical protein